MKTKIKKPRKMQVLAVNIIGGSIIALFLPLATIYTIIANDMEIEILIMGSIVVVSYFLFYNSTIDMVDATNLELCARVMKDILEKEQIPYQGKSLEELTSVIAERFGLLAMNVLATGKVKTFYCEIDTFIHEVALALHHPH